MGSAAYAYSIQDHIYPTADVGRPNQDRRQEIRRRYVASERRAAGTKMPLHVRVAIILGGALLGWAVPIACAACLL